MWKTVNEVIKWPPPPLPYNCPSAVCLSTLTLSNLYSQQILKEKLSTKPVPSKPASLTVA